MKVKNFFLCLLFASLESGQSRIREVSGDQADRELKGGCNRVPGGSLDPCKILKFVEPLVIPPEMPRSGNGKKSQYKIAVRQFEQQILPRELPVTTTWGYGSVDHPGTVAEGGTFNNPSLTIEATRDRRTRVRWINDLTDHYGNPLPHLFAVDRSLHWANPELAVCLDGEEHVDCRPEITQEFLDAPYKGPVPMVIHVHGAHTSSDSDGYPEAWYLPASAKHKISPITGNTYAMHGNLVNSLIGRKGNKPVKNTRDGYADYSYLNDQPSTTLWYHDHTLGLTRLNVAAASAGFYIIREKGRRETGLPRKVNGKLQVLPFPAPRHGDAPGTRYYEIPLAIQDRSFNEDGSLFYPADRAFFEGLGAGQIPSLNEGVNINFIPSTEPTDISPIWNPEFFGSTLVVNGKTWPYLDVEPRRYRLRLLNACDSRFLILSLKNTYTEGEIPIHVIGSEQGLLPKVATVTGGLLMGPAERPDVIIDFTHLPHGTVVRMINTGPDEPYGGGIPGEDFDPADPSTTGQVMEFRVVNFLIGVDESTPAEDLLFEDQTQYMPPANAPGRTLALVEEESKFICAETKEDDTIHQTGSPGDSDSDGECEVGEPFGPQAAVLGYFDTASGVATPQLWVEIPQQNPAVGDTEVWEFYNLSVDAHPMHLHLVKFLVLGRQNIDKHGNLMGYELGPEPWETGFKDTVVSLPGTVTRIKATFDLKGLFVWHCHILAHEDNEMMLPMCVGGLDGCFLKKKGNNKKNKKND